MNGVLWLVYVLGGFGLVRGSEWGRILTLIATSGSLIAMFVLPIFGEGAELAYMSTVWILFGTPAISLFVWALLVGPSGVSEEVEVLPPTGHSRKLRISRRTLHNIAYISFVVLGLISFWTSYFVYSEIRAAGGGTGGVDGVLGFLVIIPFGIPLLLALILGPGISLLLWHDYRLLALTVLSLGLVIALSSLGYETWPMLLSPYGAVCVTISLAWFLKYRRRSDELSSG